MNNREQMNIVVVGHVDHGKSTVIGRLLADTGSLPVGKLEQVKAQCQRNARPFEYAFLLDALKDEQAQGITIDTARCFFKTRKRDYIIIDAPGHVEFLKNMVSGAARAEAALLVIDAHEGIAENSKRHGYLVSMLGIDKLIVLVNKMDLIGHNQSKFDSLVNEYGAFLKKLGTNPVAFIPVSAMHGDNLVSRSETMPWYSGDSVLDMIDGLEKRGSLETCPFRFPVQDIYKFTESGDDRRIIAGTVESGSIKTGDTVVFQPSGKSSTITSIEGFNEPLRNSISAGYSTGFTLKDELYLKRGEIMCKSSEPQPVVTNRFRANIFWMGKAPLIKDKKYKLKLGTLHTKVRLIEVLSCIDATELSTVSGKQQVDRHDVAECIFETSKPVAFDPVTENESTGRFVIVDIYDIAGGGIILGEELNTRGWLSQHVKARETLWEKSRIAPSLRSARNGHQGKTILIYGESNRKEIAHSLESALYNSKFQCYYCGIENLRAGLDSDLNDPNDFADERINHLGELARVMTDAGLIFITTVDLVDETDIATLRKLNEPYDVLVVSSGTETALTGADLVLSDHTDIDFCVNRIVEILRSQEVIPDYAI